MRDWTRRMNVISRISVLLFCIALLSTEIYPADTASYIPDSYIADTSSAISFYNKKADVIEEILDNFTSRAVPDISSGTLNPLSSRIHSFKIIFFTVLLGNLVISWTIFVVLLLNRYFNRLYLIVYIHNSDGEKGLAASILTV